MRFLADMGISPRAVRRLQAAGHDAVHVAELRLHRATDPEIVRLARSENRIVVTHDLDFGTIMAASGESAPSLIIFRPAGTTCSPNPIEGASSLLAVCAFGSLAERLFEWPLSFR